jgi:hypothetical protein
MATSLRVYSDLPGLSNFVKQTAVSQSKNLIIDVLREYFRKDTFYRFETDSFGFPLTPDLTDLPPDINEERTTRIYIGDVFRFDKRFYPSITIRHSSGNYKPISFNQNHTTKYRSDLVLDGYGGRSYIKVATHEVITGAWNMSFEVKIAAESTPDREELSDIISGFFQGVIRDDLTRAGLFVKGISISGETEEEWGNEKIYMQSITLDCFSEWRREIPLDDLLETVNFCFNYNILGSSNDVRDYFLVSED